MPGRFFLETPLIDVARWMNADAPRENEPPRRNIAPGEEIFVLGADRKLQRMRWGIIPVGRVNARGRPVMETIVNARSETVFEKSAFEGMRRVIVPCNGWYEWTREKRKKTAWRIRPKGQDLMAFAALADRWVAPGGREIDQVATITCEPNADVRDIHHRMGVVLEPENFDVWLGEDQDAAQSLMEPWEAGRLIVDAASDVDWQAP